MINPTKKPRTLGRGDSQHIGGCYDTAKRNKGQPVKTIGGLTGKFKKMCDLYFLFSQDWKDVLDMSLIHI